MLLEKPTMELFQNDKSNLDTHLNDFFSDKENIIKLFSHSNDGMVITDHKNRILLVNPAFLEITGYDFEDVYMKDPKILQSGKTPKSVFENMWETIMNDGTWTGELVNRKKSGELYYSHVTTTYIKKEKKENSFFIAINRDITGQKKATETISYMVHHDSLTDLPNRSSFVKHSTQMLKEADKRGQRMALLFIDLDRFKIINDTFGHYYGDNILKETAKRLQFIFPENSIIARFGGDEFVVLLPDASTERQVKESINDLFDYLQTHPYSVKNNQYFITSSVGVSFYPDHGDTPDKLIQMADVAMYQSKQEEKNNYHFFTYSMSEGSYKQFLLHTQLQQALAENQFVLYYQPQKDLTNGQVYGVEALIRWQHPTKGILLPAEFLAEAEESGLIGDIDKWVMHEALRQMKAWHDAGHKDLTISVNVSKKYFEGKDFVKNVEQVLEKTQIDPSLVCIEITENFALMHAERAIEKLTALKGLGVQLAVDDFGTGYSSLSQLIHFPIDKLKIDQAFVKTSNGQDENAALVKTIIQISKHLGLAVVCEGVETETQLNFIQEEGCDLAQGFWYQKPMPATELFA